VLTKSFPLATIVVGGTTVSMHPTRMLSLTPLELLTGWIKKSLKWESLNYQWQNNSMQHSDELNFDGSDSIALLDPPEWMIAPH
jgi:hypothetical protein